MYDLPNHSGKTLIFSDTHLTHKFGQKRYNFLRDIITDHDNVIIAGDFVDGWIIHKKRFLESKWTDLFSILKEKNTVYIYGNHDPTPFLKDNYKLFSKIYTNEYRFCSGSMEFKVSHGHEITPFLKLPPLKRKYLNFISIGTNKEHKKVILYLIATLQKNCLNLLGERVFTKSKINEYRNKLIKDNHTKNFFLITGDTHFPELDMQNMFANTGFILSGFASYITVEKNNVYLTKTNC